MRNDVLDIAGERGKLARRSVDRSLERRRASYEDEVRRLVEAGFSLIRARGDLEPRVSEIVAEAGLSNQTFYRHFKSKDELLVAVLDDGIRQLAGYAAHQMDGSDDPVEKIRRWVGALCEQALNPKAAAATRPFALSRARLAERFPEEVAASERQLTAPLEAAIERAVAAEAIPDADPARDAAALYDLAMGWMQRVLANPAGTRRADAEHLVAFALRGLGSPPRGRGAAQEA
jgi:AcrR family transcriptional regulator